MNEFKKGTGIGNYVVLYPLTTLSVFLESTIMKKKE